MDFRNCQFCGFGFDHDLLGKYGCPNCEGEGDETHRPALAGPEAWEGALSVRRHERVNREPLEGGADGSVEPGK